MPFEIHQHAGGEWLLYRTGDGGFDLVGCFPEQADADFARECFARGEADALPADGRVRTLVACAGCGRGVDPRGAWEDAGGRPRCIDAARCRRAALDRLAELGRTLAGQVGAWRALRKAMGLPEQSPDGGKDFLERVKVLDNPVGFADQLLESAARECAALQMSGAAANYAAVVREFQSHRGGLSLRARLAQAEADVARLRKRTHEIQEKADREAAELRKRLQESERARLHLAARPEEGTGD